MVFLVGMGHLLIRKWFSWSAWALADQEMTLPVSMGHLLIRKCFFAGQHGALADQEMTFPVGMSHFPIRKCPFLVSMRRILQPAIVHVHARLCPLTAGKPSAPSTSKQSAYGVARHCSHLS